MKEIYKDIPGYVGFYKVSNYGNVISVPRNGTIKIERKLKQYLDKYGYLKVILNKNGVKKNKYIHQLVASAFLNNPNNYLCVNHINENKIDNNVNNLEWCSIIDNNNYGTRNKRISENGRLKINQYKLDGTFIKQWNGFAEISKELKIDTSSIIRCCRKQYKTSNGYIWRYAK